MLKKAISGLFVLLLIAVLGITALFFWVDPNNYKNMITQFVKEKTGYELTIEGDLRWHIWPRISLLSESVKLQAQGKTTPLLTADNIRFDIELLPLLSKKLMINQVLINSAVVTLSEESSYSRKKNAADSSSQSSSPVPKKSSWYSVLNKLHITNGLLVIKRGDKVINVRDVNLFAKMISPQQIDLDVEGHIYRNQHDLNYTLNTKVDISEYPDKLFAEVKKLNYAINGANLPPEGLRGNLMTTVTYQKSPRKIVADNINITVNNNQMTGSVKATYADRRVYDVNLFSDKFTVPFFASNKRVKKSKSEKYESAISAVTVNQLSSKNKWAFLTKFDANFSLAAKKLIIGNVTFDNVIVAGDNHAGLAKATKIEGDIAGGKLTANAIVNGTVPQTEMNFSVNTHQIDAVTLFKLFNIQSQIDGRLDISGDFVSHHLSDQFLKQLSGKVSLTTNEVKFSNIDVEDIIKSTINTLSKDTVISNKTTNFTEFKRLSAQANLSQGLFQFNSMSADSETIDITGMGWLNLNDRTTNLNLQVLLLQGWNQGNKIVNQLQKVKIPLQVYGDWDQLKYDINLRDLFEHTVTEKLSGKVEKKIKLFLNKIRKKDNPNSHNGDQSTKEQLKKSLNDLLN